MSIVGKACRQVEKPDASAGFRSDFHAGLRKRPRILVPKYFYDAKGSELFDRICGLEEYYPFRVEKTLLREHAREISRLAGRECRVVEYGSGSSEKTRLLLESLRDPVAYIPIDISGEQLHQSAKEFAGAYPGVEVLPVCADYTEDYKLPSVARAFRRTLFFFPGSTIGNFLLRDAMRFLRRIAEEAERGDGLLVGIALQTDRAVLERAYNDAAGLTAAFNLNILRRARDELGAKIDVDGFAHQAIYDAERSRIEMRLVSRREQAIELDGVTYPFRAGEVLVTEYSHKYTDAGFIALASRAGFRSEAFWTDPRGLFSIHFLTTSA